MVAFVRLTQAEGERRETWLNTETVCGRASTSSARTEGFAARLAQGSAFAEMVIEEGCLIYDQQAQVRARHSQDIWSGSTKMFPS